ncbi:GDSL-type esterase/lipase family protein [Lactococcus kimchii]|uniref:GDSL-type esterase/lipase family protein n=1 Tax=Lactococcus sp. S-13 TaxID=2507158 RepID=UPI001022DD30|nr:GDSL-type esterase/lipase family protein [Lactococcus sp. S-13]RZI48929.1 esterase [Lactococcus sp. S-13]
MKITIFGDSVTNGFGMDEGGSSTILARLIEQKRPDIKVILYGMNGDDTYGALFRLKYVAQEAADLNFVFFGANDASPYHLIRLQEFQDNLAQIISRLGPKKTILITPPFYNDDEPMHYSKLSEVKLFRQATIDLAERKGIQVIDIFQTMSEHENPKGLLRADGIHFTPETYELLAEEILRSIKEFVQ